MILLCGSWFALVLSCRDNAEIDLYISCKRCTVSETNAFVGEIRNLILDKGFCFEVPFIAPVIANKTVYPHWYVIQANTFFVLSRKKKERFSRTFSFLLSLYVLICTF